MAEIGKLKPCPFCGKAPVVERSGSIEGKFGVDFRFRIRCINCGAIPRGATGKVSVTLNREGEIVIEEDEREKAAGAWNHRAYGGVTDE